jgi:hypothetical protein
MSVFKYGVTAEECGTFTEAGHGVYANEEAEGNGIPRRRKAVQ